MSKRLSGNIGGKEKTSSWHLIGFPDGNGIESTDSIMSGRNPLLYCTLTFTVTKGNQAKQKQKRHGEHGYSSILLHWV